MDFRHVLAWIAAEFEKEGVDFALIGGLALAAHGVARATNDLDILVEGGRGDDVARIMGGAGYRELHRSPDAANYVADDPRFGRVDLLFARRSYTTAMLARARPHAIGALELRVVDAEDLIGLKVQSSSNDPKRRLLDMSDIERLLREGTRLDMARIREYFRIFDREAELEGLLASGKP